MLKKRFITIVLSFCLLATAFCGGASYQPGMASNPEKLNAPLEPPAKALGKDSFQVTSAVQLFFEKRGQGEKVLFIHGGPGIPNKPEGGMTMLKGFEVYFYHARGTGKSTRPVIKFEDDSWFKNPPVLEKKLGMSAQVADIERIRQILTEEKLNIIGLSYGGLIASMYAVEFPHRVKSLVLVNPAPIQFDSDNQKDNLYARIGEYQQTDEQKKAYAEYTGRFFATFKTLWQQDESSLRKLLSEMWPYYFRAAEKQGMKLPARIPPEYLGGWHSFALFLSAGQEYDYTGVIKEKLKARTLLLLGDNDITKVTEYEPYRRSLSNHKEVIIKGAGHFPHVDRPGEFARGVRDFLMQK